MLDPTVQHGRVVISPSPYATPGCCAICGYAGRDRSYIDYRLDFEFYGTLYFCTDCGMEPARLLGWIDPGRALELLRINEDLTASLTALQAKASELEHSLDVLAAKRLAAGNHNFMSDVRVSNDAMESIKTDVGFTPTATEGEGRTNPKAVESTASQRPDDSIDPDLFGLIGE